MLDLTSIKKSKDIQPPKIVIHGEPGVGKSTFAANGPEVLFLDCESGLSAITCAKVKIECLKDLTESLTSFLAQDHQFKTLVIDSIDALETFIHTEIEQKHRVDAISRIDYGKGYDEAFTHLKDILFLLDKIRETKKTIVILIAHSVAERMDDPIVGSFSRWGLKLHRKISAKIEEWADCIFYAEQQTFVETNDVGFGKKVNRAIGGNRVIYTQCNPAYVAKNRYGLPPVIPLNWDEFYSKFMDCVSEKAKGPEDAN